MIKVGRKEGYCLIIWKNMLGLTGLSNLLLTLVLKEPAAMVGSASEVSGQAGSGQPLARKKAKRDFFALRHKNKIPGNFFLKRKGSPYSGVEKELLQVPQLQEVLLSSLVLFLSPSFQGSCVDPAVVSAPRGSAGNAPPLHLENLSIH